MTAVRGDELRGDTVTDGIYHALPDPVTDRVFAVLTAVVAEVWTVRDRLRIAEATLAEHDIAVEAAYAARRDTDAELAVLRADRDAFVARVFGALTPQPPAAP